MMRVDRARAVIVCLVGVLSAAALVSPSVAAPVTVANFRNDFQTGTPKAGWSYLWNANGPIGNSANYVPLAADNGFGGDYETQGNGTRPDAAPGSNLTVGSTFFYPGQAAGQATTNTVDRYAIVAYTLSPADLAAAGVAADGTVQLSLTHYSFIPDSSPGSDGVNASLYLNNTPLRTQQGLPPGFAFTDTDFGPFPLGPARAGDTLYIGIGATGPAALATGGVGNDTNDTVAMDFTLAVEAPEPASIGLAGTTAGLLLLRRRRTVR